MKREELEALGMAKEQIDKVLDMHHEELDPVQKDLETAQADLTAEKTKTATQETTIKDLKKDLEEFKDADVSGMKQKIEDLEKDIKTKDETHQQEIADRDFNDLLKESIASANGKNAKAITALLDVDVLKASKNQKEDIAAAIKTLTEAETGQCYNINSTFFESGERRLKKSVRIAAMIFTIFAILIAVEIIISYKCLTVTDYKIKSDKIKETTKIVLISDLHNSQFGSKNKRLVDKIQKQDPDLILMDGDMLNEDGKNAQTAVELISALKKTAPVYYALGNHEIAYRQRRDKNLYQKLQKAGAKVVEKEYEDIKVRSNKIRIGGLYEYAFAVDGAGNMVKKSIPSKVRDFLMDYENTDAFKIMLSHRPDSFVFGQAADTWKIDLVVSGHVHGGQVRIPGKGGLYGGDQGWFPEYTDGIHHFKTVNHMIITRGLGSDKEKLPRFHNIPEIVVIRLEKR